MSYGQVCRICGCTDDNCRQCIEKTGWPCAWIDTDLCSACEEHKDKKLVLVRCNFSDRLGSGHVASFDTWITPGNETEELNAICLQELDIKGFKEISIQELTYSYHEDF